MSGSDPLLRYICQHCLIAALTSSRLQPATGPSFLVASALAREMKLAVVYGFGEQAEGMVYNSVNLIRPDGSLGLTYRKAHLWGADEKGTFTAGKCLGPVVELCGWKVGALICCT